MARTYYVKKAQQRYETKPVIDPATGEQKQTPKMRKGVQMKSKHGRPVFMRVTERDLTRPKPLLKCSKCGNEIQIGSPYKYTETYNRTIIRCNDCPTPHQWEYSSSLSALLAQIEYENDASTATSRDELEEVRDNFAQAVRDLSEQKQESADNIEQGFGHETEQSAELADIADQLSSWADDIEGVDFPEDPEAEETECEACSGTGEVDPNVECAECGGTGTQDAADEPSEDQLETWLDEARQALEDKFGECPV